MTSASIETEIKLAVPSAKQGKALLTRAGFRIFRRRVFESNAVLDTTSLSLRQAGQLLRLRQAGKVSTLTYKGPALAGRHKRREELEIQLPEGATIDTILTRLGYSLVFRYEKYRTEFARPGDAGHATLDETPVGVFLELEGAPAWIDSTASALGFRESDYITASYVSLYLEECRRRGVAPTHMEFPAS